MNKVDGAPQYFQKVKTTICENDGEECGQGSLFSGVATFCKQEYSDHKLVALSGDKEELEVDTFSFPSCCSCYKNDDFTSFASVPRSGYPVPALRLSRKSIPGVWIPQDHPLYSQLKALIKTS